MHIKITSLVCDGFLGQELDMIFKNTSNLTLIVAIKLNQLIYHISQFYKKFELIS